MEFLTILKSMKLNFKKMLEKVKMLELIFLNVGMVNLLFLKWKEKIP
jgi:hypothetical protein